MQLLPHSIRNEPLIWQKPTSRVKSRSRPPQKNPSQHRSCLHSNKRVKHSQKSLQSELNQSICSPITFLSLVRTGSWRGQEESCPFSLGRLPGGLMAQTTPFLRVQQVGKRFLVNGGSRAVVA